MRTAAGPGGAPAWSCLRDEELLAVPLRALRLRVRGTRLEPLVWKLRGELAARGLRFKPHVWLSSEWFTPDGVTGFAIPFYLAHPRLRRLEYVHVGRVEGASDDECLRLLRHETGHALSNAYALHRRRGWRETFGYYSSPYRVSYVPDPRSRRYVRNLGGWYAQSHPAEDFCETFATWLRLGDDWRRRYAGWKALQKLEYVDGEMRRIARLPPRALVREQTESLGSLGTTLERYYRRKRQRSDPDDPQDRLVRRLFGGRRAPGSPAHVFLRARRCGLLRAARRRGVEDLYAADQLLERWASRAFDLGLRLGSRPEPFARVAEALVREARALLTGRTRLEYSR